jgi:leucyl-tRNA synthetase
MANQVANQGARQKHQEDGHQDKEAWQGVTQYVTGTASHIKLHTVFFSIFSKYILQTKYAQMINM